MNENYIIKDSVLTAITEEGTRQGIFILPEGITDINDGVFNGVIVKEITFPASLKNIPEWILMGHAELEKVTISSGTERIMEYAFAGCHWLKDVIIPNSVTAIESYAFEECESLESLHLPESLKVIEDGAFCGCSSLEEIDIPDGIEEIQDDTFSGCGSLKEIRFPDSLRIIYGEPFLSCTSLRSITIPESVSRINNNAFLGCPALTDIFFESNELELGDGFYVPNGCRVHRNSNLTKEILTMNDIYVIKDSVLTSIAPEGIRQGIFILPEGITDISDGVFNKIAVREITFPSSLKCIPEAILTCHKELEKVTISKGTERIMENAFDTCSSLREVIIPDSVTGIEMYAFQDCESLKSIHLPESVDMIDIGAFCGCISLEEINIPEGVESIHDYTFSTCESLKEIKLPDSLKMIYEEPFWGCKKLTMLTIPENVSWIDEGAFRGCTALMDIFIESEELELGDGVYIPNGCRIHRPGCRVYVPDNRLYSLKNDNDEIMSDEEAKKAYFAVCRHEFPKFVETVTAFCSGDPFHCAEPDDTDKHGHYRTKEEVLSFALRLISEFGPYPPDSGLIRDAWDYAFDDWDEVCPPHPELKECGTESMSEEELSSWYEEHYDSLD